MFDHTSIIATLRSHFGLGGPLTPRDGKAPLFENLISAGNALNPGPEELPELDLKIPEGYDRSGDPADIDKVDKRSLAHVMYNAVPEKHRRLGR